MFLEVPKFHETFPALKNFWLRASTDINGTSNIIYVSIDEDINIGKSNGNDERFIDDFVDFKKFFTFKISTKQLLTLI